MEKVKLAVCKLLCVCVRVCVKWSYHADIFVTRCHLKHEMKYSCSIGHRNKDYFTLTVSHALSFPLCQFLPWSRPILTPLEQNKVTWQRWVAQRMVRSPSRCAGRRNPTSSTTTSTAAWWASRKWLMRSFPPYRWAVAVSADHRLQNASLWAYMEMLICS